MSEVETVRETNLPVDSDSLRSAAMPIEEVLTSRNGDQGV
jgi:hypothetical protein